MINIIDNILKCVTEIKPKSLIKKINSSINEIPNIIYQILEIQSKNIYFELSSYDVYGNDEDGYEVNDVYNKQIFSEEVFIFRNEIILSDKEVIDLIAWGKDIVVEWNDCYIKSSDGKI